MNRRLSLALALTGCLLAAPALAKAPLKTFKFAPGASSGEASGSIVRGSSDRYQVGARKGQTMHVVVTAREDNAAFQIYQPGWKVDVHGFPVGTCLKGAGEADDASSWSGRLPADGNYLVVVGPKRGNTAYRLSVGIK